jgi:sugar lactone lactonase YvrE
MDCGSRWPADGAGPKLVNVDLKTNTNKVSRVIPFGPDIAKSDSYLNDVRVDLRNNDTAYLTDSGMGGIVVLDLSTGAARRPLDGHPFVLAEPNVSIVIDGKPVLGPDGTAPQTNSDGIALSPDGEYLITRL